MVEGGAAKGHARRTFSVHTGRMDRLPAGRAPPVQQSRAAARAPTAAVHFRGLLSCAPPRLLFASRRLANS